MLDVILTILSIIGICLLVILGILLAILLIVLFFPISYKAAGEKRAETFWVEAKVNWLFRLIRVRFAYPEPGNVVVKVLWFTLFDSKAEKKGKKTSAEAQLASGGNEAGTSADTVTERAEGKTAGVSAETDKTGAGEGDPGIVTGAVADSDTDSSAHMSQDTAESQENGKKAGFLQKISGKIEKIKFKILNIYDKIKYIWENIKFYKDLLQEEQTKTLLKHLMLRLKKILWSVRPRKINADIVFGASSPDTTGYCMAVYGILSPILGKSVRFTPDFEQAVFKGEFSLAGHITLFTIVMHACIFALDKKLRILIRKIKKFHKKQVLIKEENGQTAA
ncbi:MAG: hypothetical protein E7286_02710 [Lachnospiraceae bacterium]|nr:hypothetical protein [Lachnospiraceae bacterium]